MLAERELDWAMLPHMTRKDALRYLSAGESLCLDNAVTNHEERPHLVKAYKDLDSAGFNEVVYTDKGDYRALRWVMKRGIDLRGFTLEVKGDHRSGPVLRELMDDHVKEIEGDLVIANYYAARGRLREVDATLDGTRTALLQASEYGQLNIVKALLAAGADKDKANILGWTPLHVAVIMGRTEIVAVLNSAATESQSAAGGSIA